MPRSPRRLVVVAAALLLPLSVAVVPAASAATSSPSPSPSPAAGAPSPSSAPTVVTFGVEPASAKGRDGRSYFAIGATAGAVLADHVAVLNYSAAPLVLSVMATDARNTDTGGITGLTAGEKPSDAGSWIRLAHATAPVRVPAASAGGPGQVVLPFSVHVPTNATPGDHSGLILVTLSTLAKDARGVNVRLDQRVGTRVFLRVSGQLRPALSIEHLAAAFRLSRNPFRAGTTTVTFDLVNTGNVKLGGLIGVDVAGLLGQDARTDVPVKVPLLLPGNSVPVRVVVPGTYPELRETATVTVLPVKATGDVDGTVPPVTASVTALAVPWPLLAVVAAALLLLGVAWWLRRRRRRTRVRQSDDPAAPRQPEPVGGRT